MESFSKKCLYRYCLQALFPAVADFAEGTQRKERLLISLAKKVEGNKFSLK